MAKYKDAIDWIAQNDDSDLGEPDDAPLISICLVADIWNKDTGTVRADVIKRRKRLDRGAPHG